MKLSAIIAPLIAAKVPHSVIMQTVQAWEEQQADALEKRRKSDAERQARKREKDASHVTSRDVTVTVSSHEAGVTRGEDNLQTTEITGKEEKKVASPSARPSRGSRIPDDFCPDIEAAVAEGVPRLEAERQARSFCDYWRSKPGAGGLKLDWPATWRVWYRRNIPAVSKPQSTAPPRKPRTVAELAIHRLETGQTTHEPPDEPDRRLGQSFGSGQAQGPGVLELVAIAANGHR